MEASEKSPEQREKEDWTWPGISVGELRMRGRGQKLVYIEKEQVSGRREAWEPAQWRKCKGGEKGQEMHNKHLCIGTKGAWKLAWVLMYNHEHMAREVTFSGRQELFSQVSEESLDLTLTFNTSKYEYLRNV